MKKLTAIIIVLFALGVATVAHASVPSNCSSLSNDGKVINHSTSGDFLSYLDNYRIYDFVSETKNSNGTTTRLWKPKKEIAVITDNNSYSYVGIYTKAYNFDESGKQITGKSTDFSKLKYLGEFNINSNTIYRFYK